MRACCTALCPTLTGESDDMATSYVASYAAGTPPSEIFEASLQMVAGEMVFDAPAELDRRARDVTPPRFAGGPARRKRLHEAHERSFTCGASTSSAGQAALLPTEPFFADELGDGLAAPPAFSVREVGSLQGGVARRVIYDEREQPIEWPWEASQRATAPPQGALADGAPAPDVDHAAAYFAASNPHGDSWGSHSADATVQAGLAAASGDGKGGESSTGVRAWKEFNQRRGFAYLRPIDPRAPLWVKLAEEQHGMRFISSLIDDRAVAVSTARAYYGAANAWHLRRTGISFAAGMDTKRLTEMVKGLRKLLDDPPTQLRRGISPELLQKGMDIVFPPTSPQNVNIRALLATSIQGLLRGREAGCKVKFDAQTDVARGDIATCTPGRLAFFMRPAKNMKYRKGKTVPIVIGGGGGYVDAVAEVRRMLEVDPTPEGRGAVTPMFRKPDGSAFTTDDIRDIVRQVAFAAGEDPLEFGAHSLRIGGATALFAAGADPIHIRTMGRWSSDCYRLYVRACFEQTMDWTRKLGSQQVHDVQGTYARSAQEVELY